MIFEALFKPKDLWSAARRGNTKAIEELVASGQDVNAKKTGFVKEGYPPLHIAVLYEQKEAIKVLVRLGADVNSRNKDQETPLWIAVNLKEPDILELLLDLGAGIDARPTGMTVLDWAAFDGKSEMVRVLLARGADINTPHCGGYALGSAAIGGHADFVRVLLQAGADPNQAEDSGTTPLFCAVAGRKLQVVKLIVEAGAKLNAVRFHGNAETAL